VLRYLHVALRFCDERRQSLAERSCEPFCDVDGGLAFTSFKETDVGVMNASGLGECFLREPLPSAVLSDHASERRGELR
jgi:hypothetical protein